MTSVFLGCLSITKFSCSGSGMLYIRFVPYLHQTNLGILLRAILTLEELRIRHAVHAPS